MISGIGAQGGDIEKTVGFITNKDGKMAIIVSGHSIIHAETDKDFSRKTRFVTINTKDKYSLRCAINNPN